MRNKWKFFGLFVLYALILSMIWFRLHAVYIHLPVAIAEWVLDIVAYSGNIVEVAERDGKTFVRFPEYAPDVAYIAMNVVFNTVPFVALVLATPSIKLRFMIMNLIYGLSTLFFLHVLSIISMFFRAATGFIWKDAVYLFFASLLEALAPLILWFIFIGKEIIFPKK
ncbi:MAG: hypothetical protein B6244_05815 [Candidatus Cloacimonetes bacterium 4572_55]|nr:MAG: hypothetical protein B6244_05815 [Candidatus Cloacimonetes bacterium 4572_55]